MDQTILLIIFAIVFFVIFVLSIISLIFELRNNKPAPEKPIDRGFRDEYYREGAKLEYRSNPYNDIGKATTVDLSVVGAISQYYRYETGSDMNIGTRESQEDYIYVSNPDDNYALGILCDGMGGMADGAQASQMTVDNIRKAYSQYQPKERILDFLSLHAKRSDDMVSTYAESRGLKGGAGTTLCAVIVRDGILYWTSVGDSRIYLVRDRRITQLSEDHNYALQLNEQFRKGLITRAQADNDPQKEALISYIGMGGLTRIGQNQETLRDNDLILLCSDGLTKTLSDESIMATLQKNMKPGNLTETARLLVTSAFDAAGSGGQDNTSVVLIQYHERSH